MLNITSHPTSFVISLEELKERLRVDHSDDDSDIEMLREAATEMFEERAMVVLRPTGYSLSLPGFMSCIQLPVYPVRAVTAITYVDEDGNQQVVSDTDYSVAETAEGATITFAGGWTRPTVNSDAPYPVTVAFEAGYDDPYRTESGKRLKAKIVVAVSALVDHWYHNRSAVSDPMSRTPLSFETIARQERIFR